MIKIKTFMYEGTDFVAYTQEKIGLTADRYYYYDLDASKYDLDASKVDEEINNFTKKHKVISVTPVTFVEGDSVTTSVIMYTIVYEEDEQYDGS